MVFYSCDSLLICPVIAGRSNQKKGRISMKALAFVLLAILLFVLLRRKVCRIKGVQRGAPRPLMNKNIDIPVSMVIPLPNSIPYM